MMDCLTGGSFRPVFRLMDRPLLNRIFSKEMFAHPNIVLIQKFWDMRNCLVEIQEFVQGSKTLADYQEEVLLSSLEPLRVKLSDFTFSTRCKKPSGFVVE